MPINKLVTVKTGKKDANFAVDNGKYYFFTCGAKPLRCDTFDFEGKAILIAGNGTFSVKKFNGKFNAYQRTYVLIPYEDQYFVPLYFSVLNETNYFISSSRG